MSVASSIKEAREHHAKHGDMDGDVCLLSACALHYPNRCGEPVFGVHCHKPKSHDGNHGTTLGAIRRMRQCEAPR